MISSGTINTIYALSAQGTSIHAITREPGIDRNTVRRYARDKSKTNLRPERGSKLDAYKWQIHSWIKEVHVLGLRGDGASITGFGLVGEVNWRSKLMSF